MSGEYYIGLDIGTSSIGWAVTDKNYKIARKKGKSLWGIRLFDEAQTAEERRMFRTARRRNKRNKQRIEILQELLGPEIEKVDPDFYLRLDESFFRQEDKKVAGKYSIFNDKNFNDRDYHAKYPTIYHLRYDLMTADEKRDIRLYYLAISHILSNRGHFLFEGQSFSVEDSFDGLMDSLGDYVRENIDENFNIQREDYGEIGNILKDKGLNLRDKNKELKKIFANNKLEKEIIKFIVGQKGNLSNLYLNLDLEDWENTGYKFSEASYEEEEEELRVLLGDDFLLLEILKAIYDWSVLEGLLSGEKYLSKAKIRDYDKHASDLRDLKTVYKSYLGKDKYRDMFRSDKYAKSYTKYIEGKLSMEDINKEIEKQLKTIKEEDSTIDRLLEESALRSLLPKQRSGDNSVIPYQIHHEELKLILARAEADYPFLRTKEDGFSIKDKILQLHEFRIPYYVGPLNNYHGEDGFAWSVRKKEGRVYPWNFDEKIDRQASASEFIERMTNKCSYLIGKDVLPKNSILYSKFMVLNELNNLKINGKEVPVDIKQKIFKELFTQYDRVTNKRLRDYLLGQGLIDKNDTISGIDTDFKSNLSSYNYLRSVLEDSYSEKVAEDIIRWSTLFGEDKRMYRKILEDNLGEILSKDQINKLRNKRFNDWGRLSREFLTEVYHTDDQGEMKSIINLMWDSNDNLMELLSFKYDFLEEIKKLNDINFEGKDFSYEDLDDMYLSPAVKRSLWQTIRITEELVNIMGEEPDKIFIEVAREHQVSRRTSSRKKQVMDLYKSCKECEKDFLDQIEKTEENKFRSDRLFLYYTQLGKCMYSGENIDLHQLFNTNVYDIDHIYPRSLTKDDSLNNRVLVKRQANMQKGDTYPLEQSIVNKQKNYWKMLESKGFISKEKYKRLVRRERLSDTELTNFIARQLVETRQSSKAAAEIFSQIYDDTAIVYVKANNVSDFRHQFDLLKVREINDYHHAKDAYLNIVVGNVYHTKFTRSPYNYVKKAKKRQYNLARMYDFDVIRGEEKAWITGKNESIGQVKKQMDKNDILYTFRSFRATGGFYDQTLMPKGKGQAPIKTSDERYDIEKYGGYNKVSGAYFSLIEHSDKKGNRVRTIESIPILIADEYLESEEVRRDYLINTLELIDPEVRYKEIKIGSLFKIDGFPMNVTGRSNNALLLKSNVQLIIDKDKEEEIRNIVKSNGYDDIDKRIHEYEKREITDEKLIKIYIELENKLGTSVYAKKYSYIYGLVKDGFDVFKSLSIDDKGYVILEILKLFRCTSETADLRKINQSKSVGILKNNKKINNNESFELINQSITGIYENKVNLLEI